MPNRVNTLMLREFEDRYRDADYIIAVGFDGLSGGDTYAFRGELESKNLSLSVVKNSIAQIAFKNLNVNGIDRILNGANGLVVGKDPVSMARTIKEFAKVHKALVIRGAVIEKEILNGEQGKMLSEMASREELIGQIAGVGLFIGGKIPSAVISQGSRIAGCLATHVERLEKESA